MGPLAATSGRPHCRSGPPAPSDRTPEPTRTDTVRGRSRQGRFRPVAAGGEDAAIMRRSPTERGLPVSRHCGGPIKTIATRGTSTRGSAWMTIRSASGSGFSRAFLGRFGERLGVGAPPSRLAAQKRNIPPTRRRADRGGILFHPLGAFFQFPRPLQIGLSQASIGHCRAPCRADAPRQPNASSFS